MVFKGVGWPWMVFYTISLLVVCGAHGMTAEEKVVLKKFGASAKAFEKEFLAEKDAARQWSLCMLFFEALGALCVGPKTSIFTDRWLNKIIPPVAKNTIDAFVDMHKSLDPAIFTDKAMANRSVMLVAIFICGFFSDLTRVSAGKGALHILFMSLREVAKKFIAYAEQCKRLMIDLRDVRKHMSEFFDMYPEPEDHARMGEYRKLIECLMSECEQKNLIGKVAGSDVLYSYAEMLEYANRIASPYVRDGLVAKISAKMEG